MNWYIVVWCNAPAGMMWNGKISTPDWLSIDRWMDFRKWPWLIQLSNWTEPGSFFHREHLWHQSSLWRHTADSILVRGRHRFPDSSKVFLAAKVIVAKLKWCQRFGNGRLSQTVVVKKGLTKWWRRLHRKIKVWHREDTLILYLRSLCVQCG